MKLRNLVALHATALVSTLLLLSWPAFADAEVIHLGGVREVVVTIDEVGSAYQAAVEFAPIRSFGAGTNLSLNRSRAQQYALLGLKRKLAIADGEQFVVRGMSRTSESAGSDKFRASFLFPKEGLTRDQTSTATASRPHGSTDSQPTAPPPGSHPAAPQAGESPKIAADTGEHAVPPASEKPAGENASRPEATGKSTQVTPGKGVPSRQTSAPAPSSALLSRKSDYEETVRAIGRVQLEEFKADAIDMPLQGINEEVAERQKQIWATYDNLLDQVRNDRMLLRAEAEDLKRSIDHERQRTAQMVEERGAEMQERGRNLLER